MDKYSELVEKTGIYVKRLFNQYRANDLKYHNLEHTKSVIKRTLEIAANYSFKETELFILSAAAWFHDTGHLVGGPELHEDRSVIIMQSFLKRNEVVKDVIDKIEGCICATKIPQQHKSLLEEIVCDADTYKLGTKDFLTTNKLLKKECELRGMPVDNWDEKTLEFLQSHKYFTSYCQALLNKGREKNIDLARSLLRENYAHRE